MFKLTKPCKDCPFIKDGHMNQSLSEGRLEEILASLEDDHNVFHCHKTINYSEDFIDTDEGDEVFTPSDKTQHCAGALIYLEKKNKRNVPMRIGLYMGDYNPSKLTGHDLIIDPKEK